MGFSLAARAVLSLVLLGLAAAGGWRQGVKSTLADWRAAELEQARAAAELRGEHERLASKAATSHEADRAAITTRLEEARHAINDALRRPARICQPGQAQPLLGELVLPVGVLDGVRHAAGASHERASAASEPGAAVPRGPADP